MEPFGTSFRKFGTSFIKFGTSFVKFVTSFVKFGTSNPSSIRTHIFSPMVHYFIWEPIRKSLEVNPHLGMHFATLGTFFIKFDTSFIKFGTSNPNATGTPMLSPMLH